MTQNREGTAPSFQELKGKKENEEVNERRKETETNLCLPYVRAIGED